ncbi:hypothetical protein SARC_04126 [Sphaeroforma arctica JP610]|uniref:Uncharacterized protein n=1 Tax=Sphaeroforma arctica JP610 TaxID=667725 RepID=A0A0L0G3E4_9EUKA|nr:hypothetical protein SARC_04126 [Sphaeroforma arctica JP610]KNC83627.1 hypothetical protein SARC_04126 [Sphaeroforma arctica JP610]|eukprot:XP_014157529.1 hypothetical protein SARC_04126 [Sphaeroforma arctica JP610]
MNNADQTEAVLMEFVAARRRENGDPIFQLNWCQQHEFDPNFMLAAKFIMDVGQKQH